MIQTDSVRRLKPDAYGVHGSAAELRKRAGSIPSHPTPTRPSFLFDLGHNGFNLSFRLCFGCQGLRSERLAISNGRKCLGEWNDEWNNRE